MLSILGKENKHLLSPLIQSSSTASYWWIHVRGEADGSYTHPVTAEIELLSRMAKIQCVCVFFPGLLLQRPPQASRKPLSMNYSENLSPFEDGGGKLIMKTEL
ncbi:unnamed protein product [Natator depressus]